MIFQVPQSSSLVLNAKKLGSLLSAIVLTGCIRTPSTPIDEVATTKTNKAMAFPEFGISMDVTIIPKRENVSFWDSSNVNRYIAATAVINNPGKWSIILEGTTNTQGRIVENPISWTNVTVLEGNPRKINLNFKGLALSGATFHFTNSDPTLKPLTVYSEASGCGRAAWGTATVR